MASTEIEVLSAEPLSRETSWQKQDTIWMLGLYGTAIGAGTLFLPIDAGMNGFIPLLIITLLAFPMTYFSHRALCRFVLSGSQTNSDITSVVDEHFGSSAGRWLTFLYFFAIYPILLMYSVAITNTTQSFISHQIGITPPPRAVVSLMLILGLMAIIRLGEQIIVKSMSLLVYPFIFVLIGLAVYLVPQWNSAFFTFSSPGLSIGSQVGNMLLTLWLIIPVVVFSFNHSPIISSFAVKQKQLYGKDAEIKGSKILRYSHLMMIGTVMFFVYSCVLSLSPADLALAKKQNISILSYLANHFHTPVIAYLAPLIAFIAISKSFLGHYLGAREGMFGMVMQAMTKRGLTTCRSRLNLLIDGFMILTCWIVATINPSILGMIETLGGPVIAMILFLMPMYAIAKVPAMKKYQSIFSDVFITLIGLIAFSAMLYGLIT